MDDPDHNDFEPGADEWFILPLPDNWQPRQVSEIHELLIRKSGDNGWLLSGNPAKAPQKYKTQTFCVNGKGFFE